MWSEETGFVTIPLPPGVLSAEPRDVNNEGEIVGRLTRPDLGGVRAFRYLNGVWTELPPTGDGIHSEGFGINDDGWACGYRDTDQGRLAFRWLGNVVEELVSPIGGGATANDINLNRATTGLFGSPTAIGLGFVWESPQVTEIPPLEGGTNSIGASINYQAAAAGSSHIVDDTGFPVGRRSWIYHANRLEELGLIRGTDSCRAVAINDAFQIVGRCSIPSNQVMPFLWQHGEIMDLRLLVHDLPDDLFLREAAAINNTGHIIVEDPANLRWVILAPLNRPFGDVNIDCTVDERDLIAVLEDWGSGKVHHPTDIVTSSTFEPPGDGVVDAADLAVVLGNWSISTEASASNRGR